MRKERIAVFPGSFDPVTLGHMDIIERAAQLFDRVYVAIVPNGEKTHPMFTDEEKLELMRVSIAPLGNVEAALWNGLLTDFAAQKGARFLVRGARNSMDFDAEYQLSLIYKDVSGRAPAHFIDHGARDGEVSSAAREVFAGCGRGSDKRKG